ncbi:hypothetical protein ACSLNR_28495, partial [Escherichia coli]
NVINAESVESAENEPEQLGLIEVEECVDVNDELKVQQSNDSNMAVSSSRSSFVITFSTELM